MWNVPQYSLQHCLQELGHGSNLDVHQQMNRLKKVVVHIYNAILLSHKKECAGVQPQLIQGIRSGDGVGDLFIYKYLSKI